LGSETNAKPLKLQSEFDEVVDLAIEDQALLAALGPEWLIRRSSWVDHRESYMSKRESFNGVNMYA
jgi:hypothetical protein